MTAIAAKRSDRRRILFVAYGGGHIEIVMPLMRELAAQHPDAELVLLALTTGYQKAKLAGFNPLGYRDFLHLMDREEVMRLGENLVEDNTHPAVDVLESRAYMGIGYRDLIRSHGREKAAQLYAEHGRHTFFPIHFLASIIEHIEPDAVVATSSPRSEQAALEAASAMGIPSVCIYNLFGQEGTPFVKRTTKADWTCVLSEAVRGHLVALGFREDRIVATGNPAFDAITSDVSRQLADKFLNERGWRSLSPILWAGYKEPSQDGLDFPLEIEGCLRRFTADNPDTALIVRYHPSCWHLYPRAEPSARVHFSQTPYEPLAPLVLASKVVVVQNSTSGLEAATIGKPVVSLEHSPCVSQSFSFSELGISTPCHATEDLPGILTQVLADPDSYVSSQYATDGTAARRAAEVVWNAIERQPTPSGLKALHPTAAPPQAKGIQC